MLFCNKMLVVPYTLVVHNVLFSLSGSLVMARFSITVDDEVTDFLDILSANLGISRSSLVSFLLTDFSQEFRPYLGVMLEGGSADAEVEARLRARGESAAIVEARMRELLNSLDNYTQPDLPL